MLKFIRLLYPEGASGGEAAGVTSADAGQSTGETSEAAAQNMESRLAQLGVPQDKIRKGAYRDNRPAPVVETTEEPEEEVPESGAADRKTWDEVKAEYKADLDAEVQNIVKARVRKEQERSQQYEQTLKTLAPIIDFFTSDYGLDPENLDADALVQHFREDSRLSEKRAMEMGTTDEVAHKLNLAELEEKRKEREAKERQKQLDAVFKRQQVGEHLQNLQAQAAELAKKVPGFDLAKELENSAFAVFTAPGSEITVEQAYYALHPEYRQAEVESVAKKTAESIAASVRAGQSRPAENGAQAASVGTVSYRNMSREQREALKKRILDAGARGEHLPIGG